MVASHIHDALSQVRKLREAVLDKRQFRGYSGPARMLSGAAALAGALVLARLQPATVTGHLIGWGVVLAVALLLNYGALLYWFLRDPQVGRNPAQLQPAFDALPPLAVAAALSAACLLHGYYDLLVPVWMSMYGLVHIPYRNTLPRANYGVGLFYITAGTACLFWPGAVFTNPWPMGLIFCAGEMTGGIILHRNRTRQFANT